MRTTNRPPTRVLTAAVLALGLASGLTGCAGGAPASDSTTAASGLGARWGDCMRSAGFDIEDPGDDQVRSGTVISPQGVDEDRFAGAADSCATELGVTRADSAAKDRWAREYDQVASCVRDAYPDFPEQQSGALSFDEATYPPAAEPEFQQLVDECLQRYSPDTKTQDAG
ncbi:hypothetical protein DEJ33_07295 [Curtobacterium sp. MCPF17_047]|uniref:hypothetical protein n=1 Tax=Curtobacterium sp. MCPF17_047 TaxID=2175654 RepID=UPI000DA72226|nr:hypothetical protein [Curtobacterium sp. MCPF17_047]PZF67052.1 hypothetical protein DEJ33_07295 [Curtobacterium sp. MCPF17_047]